MKTQEHNAVVTKLSYRRLEGLSNVLAGVLTSENLTYDDRKNLKEANRKLGDVMLGCQTKVKHAREIYAEMKAHKAYAEDPEKLKALIEKSQLEIEKVYDEEKELSLVPFKLTGDLGQKYLPLLIELEDIVLLPLN